MITKEFLLNTDYLTYVFTEITISLTNPIKLKLKCHCLELDSIDYIDYASEFSRHHFLHPVHPGEPTVVDMWKDVYHDRIWGEFPRYKANLSPKELFAQNLFGWGLPNSPYRFILVENCGFIATEEGMYYGPKIFRL